MYFLSLLWLNTPHYVSGKKEFKYTKHTQLEEQQQHHQQKKALSAQTPPINTRRHSEKSFLEDVFFSFLLYLCVCHTRRFSLALVWVYVVDYQSNSQSGCEKITYLWSKMKQRKKKVFSRCWIYNEKFSLESCFHFSPVISFSIILDSMFFSFLLPFFYSVPFWKKFIVLESANVDSNIFFFRFCSEKCFWWKGEAASKRFLHTKNEKFPHK